MTRRTILAGALFAGPLARTAETVTLPDKLDERTRAALQLRQRSALKQSTRKVAAMTPNSDEATIPNWISCFTKGLPQNQYGEVQPAAYHALLKAIESRKHA